MASQVRVRVTVGIGKSAAFSSLVHSMNTGSRQVKAALRRAFPFLAEFKHFIYLDAGFYNFDRKTEEALNLIVNDIKKNRREALVVLDEAHTLLKKTQLERGSYFYDQLN